VRVECESGELLAEVRRVDSGAGAGGRARALEDLEGYRGPPTIQSYPDVRVISCCPHKNGSLRAFGSGISAVRRARCPTGERGFDSDQREGSTGGGVPRRNVERICIRR
jgi:hypothetical protein